MKNKETVTQRDHSDLYVYTPDSGYSPFEVFLEHTSEKENTGAILAERAERLFNQEGLKILDIGAGDCSLAVSMFKKIKLPLNKIAYTYVEPVEHNISRADQLLAEIPIVGNRYVGKFEDYIIENNDNYDMIIASNLYHIEVSDIPNFLSEIKMLLSNSKSEAYFIYRDGDDDLIKFRQTFEPQIYGLFKKPRTIELIMEAIHSSRTLYEDIDWVESELEFPADEATSDKIIEFILNMDPKYLKPELKNNIYKVINEKERIFNSKQAVITLKKP